MIKKAQLFEENKKLKRKVFTFENIGIGINATIQEKEYAAKSFMEKYPSYTPFNRGAANMFNINSHVLENTFKFFNGILSNYFPLWIMPFHHNCSTQQSYAHIFK